MLCDPRVISANPIALGFSGIGDVDGHETGLPERKARPNSAGAVGAEDQRLLVVRYLDVTLVERARERRLQLRVLGVGDVDHPKGAQVGSADARRGSGERIIAALDGRELHVGAALVRDVGDDLQALALTLQGRAFSRRGGGGCGRDRSHQDEHGCKGS